MERKELVYEGKAKKLYKTDTEGVLLAEYLDQATALNGARKDLIEGKGTLNNQITSFIFTKLKEKGIPSHFIEKTSKTEQLIKEVAIIPLEVVVRNTAAGSFSKRLNIPEGTPLSFPIVEFYFKNDALDDPFINDDHVLVLNLAEEKEIIEIKSLARKVNQVLLEIFAEIDIQLIDFKIEIGKTVEGELLLADEISPDTCRLWDKNTHEHLDKDVYRRNLGQLTPVYEKVLARLENTRKER